LEELTQYLLEEPRIAVVPGSVLGKFGNDFIRISYANSYENLKIAMARMEGAIRRIRL
jgi:aspartate/methionine/tyrosine aminotransferase